jgi:uncharacterized protein YecT (DUF1311 family)
VNLIKFFLLGLTLFFFARLASADDSGLTKQYFTCMDNSGGVTAYMLNCISTETKIQDARLNKAYKELMAQLSPSRKKQLLDSQRVWLKFRDANCKFYYDPDGDGGGMASVMSTDCFVSTTASRAKELESLKQ